MSLFDSKQEVINIELTSHGKKLLAQGKLSPKYYAFFDDDVIYDYSYAALTESANGEADVRIRKQTPYLKTNYSVLGQEIKLNKGDVNADFTSKVTDYETRTILKYCLGNSKVNEVTGSRIDVLFLEGELTGAYSTGSAFIFGNELNQRSAFNKQVTKIVPKQLELTPEIRVLPEPTMTTPPELLDPDSIDIPIVSPVLADKTYVYLEVDRLLLYVDELNSVEDYKNFDINVYKIQINEAGNEEYQKLNFDAPKQSYIDDNGFLVDGDEVNSDPALITPTSVEYYFNIRIDEEIDTELLTSRAPKDSLGRPVIDDPLIKNEISFRTRSDFSRRTDFDGEPC